MDNDEKVIEELEDDEEVTEETSEPVVSRVNDSGTPQYRYMCPACTGIAYYASSALNEHSQPSCNNCGATLGAVNYDSFVLLSDNEQEQLAALR